MTEELDALIDQSVAKLRPETRQQFQLECTHSKQLGSICSACGIPLVTA